MQQAWLVQKAAHILHTQLQYTVASNHSGTEALRCRCSKQYPSTAMYFYQGLYSYLKHFQNLTSWSLQPHESPLLPWSDNLSASPSPMEGSSNHTLQNQKCETRREAPVFHVWCHTLPANCQNLMTLRGDGNFLHTLGNIQKKTNIFWSKKVWTVSSLLIFIQVSYYPYVIIQNMMYWQTPFSLNMLAQGVTLLACIWEVLSLKLSWNISPFGHMSGQYFKLYHYCLFPHQFQFIIHPVIWQYTAWAIDGIIK